MNRTYPVPPQTPPQALHVEYQSLTSASQSLFPPGAFEQDYRDHRDPVGLSPFSSDTRSRAPSVSSVASSYPSGYGSPGLALMSSLSVSREGSSAGFSENQKHRGLGNSLHSQVDMDEDGEEEQSTPTMGLRALPNSEHGKTHGGKNFPHKLYA